MEWWQYVDDVVFCQELVCMWNHTIGDEIVVRRDEEVKLCTWCGLDEREISDHVKWLNTRNMFL